MLSAFQNLSAQKLLSKTAVLDSDVIVCGDDQNSKNKLIDLIKLISPDILVKGGDYDRKKIVGGDFVKSKGGRVVIVPILQGFSTTSILKEMSFNETKT